MKKLIPVFLLISIILTACATPQVTENLPTTATSTDIPALALNTETPVPTVDATADSQPQTGTLSIRRFQMIDARVGWAEGSITSEHDPSRSSDTSYYLLRTTDGGETWQDVTPPIQFGSPASFSINLFAVDTNTAWAVPSGFPFSEQPPYLVIWRTNDGGKSWKPSNPVDISDSPIRDASPLLQFVDQKHGWLTLRFEHRVQAHYLDYRTIDGGITWEQIGSCSTFDGDIQGRCTVPLYIDAQTGWRTSPSERISTRELDPASIWQVQRTADGGLTWQPITLPHSQEAKICSHDPTRVAMSVVGIRVDCNMATETEESYYYLSADSGETWQITHHPKDADVFFLDSRTGWRTSESATSYQLEQTLDGGGNWQIQSDGLPGGGIQFVDANTGWVGIYNDSDLLRTTDAGKNWQIFTPRLLPAESGSVTLARLEVGEPLVFQSIQMIDSSNGWAVGANGYIFYTINGGKAWQDVTPLHGQLVAGRQLFALDSLRAWTTVSFPRYESIWSTSDGGGSWQQVVALSEGQAISPGSIRFLNESTGWYQSSHVGDNTKRIVQLMKTRDHGANWELQSTGQFPYSYYARDRMGFLFLDKQNGFRIEPIGEYTHALEDFLTATPILLSRTTDGGVTWQPVSLPNMVLETNELSLDEKAYPGGIAELLQDTLSCEAGTTLRVFSPDVIGLQVICKGAYRDVYGTYGYGFVLSEYYLSTDSGASWNNWISYADDFPREDEITLVASEFFLSDGVGWRLKANQLLYTTDGGRTWTNIKAVGWEAAQLHFVNLQEGWAIVKSGHAISLVHTTDGGKTWEEINPITAPD